jgi:cytochrome b pre-mRNA-processing protein 3
MISLPFRRSRATRNIDAVYGAIVAQARSVAFYRDYGVPDTVAGRLDMIMLHLVLLLQRLGADHGHVPGAMPPVGRQLFERFCRDIDDNFREMGVGDLAVPKEMQRVAAAFYGRAKAYQTALAEAGAGPLEAAVSRNVFGAADPPLGARRLAAYMRQASRRLAEQEPAALARAELEFPDPQTVA